MKNRTNRRCKQIIASVGIMCLFWTNPVLASNAVTSFTSALLTALHHCHEAGVSLEAAKKQPDNTKMFENMRLADGQFMEALGELKPWLAHDDPFINHEALTMYLAVSNLQLANLQIVSVLADSSDTPGIRQALHATMERQAEGWGLFEQAGARHLYVLLGAYSVEGSGQLRLTESERQSLLSQINQLFGSELSAYHAEMESVAQGLNKKEDVPVGRTVSVILFLEDLIRKTAIQNRQ